MSYIIYSGKKTARQAGQMTSGALKEAFREGIVLHSELKSNQKRIAYFFIDPLIKSFEAANEFYFNVFECTTIEKINTYKSGASPIQALTDAKELLDHGLYDAVLIFGHEPLLTNKRLYGKEEVARAMNIFENHSIIQCYNDMAHILSKKLEISDREFIRLCDELYANFCKTYTNVTGATITSERGRHLEDHQADLFKLTDCANPNIDFSGGIILTNEATANELCIPESVRIQVSGASYSVIEGSPEKIEQIVGKKENLFPHLRHAFVKAQNQSNVDVVTEFKKGNLYLETYTCYPPIPIGFLFAAKIIDNVKELPELLEKSEITITGGMSLARAPWNNPALNAIIDMYQKLKSSKEASFGLVHGNGGIGEVQGVAIFSRSKG